jgi:hypothetical protein
MFRLLANNESAKKQSGRVPSWQVVHIHVFGIGRLGPPGAAKARQYTTRGIAAHDLQQGRHRQY